MKTHHCAEFKKTVLAFLYLYQFGTVNSTKRIISFEGCLKKSNQFQLSQMGIPQVSQIRSLTNAELENLMLKQGKLKFRVSSIINALFSLANVPTPHWLETKLNHKKMGTLQFYIPGVQDDPSYPKQREFSKSYEGNLK